MVFGALYKQRAREEERKEWREWLNRKARAERKGEPFDEPNPSEKLRKSKGN